MFLTVLLGPWGGVTEAVAQADPEPPRPVLGDDGVPQVRFNFKGQTWDQVLDYFSRVTGLPIVRDAAVPAGTVDYINPSPYPLPQALETLNLLLQTRGLVLRDENGRLVLEKLDQIKKENIPTYIGALPDDVTADTLVTVIVPLVNATAASVSEQLKEMVADYGMVVALPEQNSLLMVETAANARRIQLIVDELDREDVENQVEQITLRYSKATDLLPTLLKLMSERVIKTVTRGKTKVQVEEDVMPAGFRITADERTNTIIARGTPRRIERLRAAIVLLDAEKLESMMTMRTVQLDRLTVAEAKAKLDQLFAGVPKENKPTYVVLDDTNRITISADAALLEQATRFLADLEQEGAGTPGEGDSVVLLPLTHATPDAAIAACRAVFTPRQAAVLKLVPGPDGRSLVAAGPVRDLDSVRKTIVLVDRPARGDREVRYLVVDATDPETAFARATRIFEAGAEIDPTLEVVTDFDPATRRLVIEGPRESLDRFEKAIDSAKASIRPETMVRQFTVQSAPPSRLVRSMTTLSRAILKPKDGSVYVPPTFEAVDELDLLVVTATADQFVAIDGLLRTLDRPQPGDVTYRVIRIGTSAGDALLEKALLAFDRKAALLPDGDLPRPEVMVDPASGVFEVLGSTPAVQSFERALAEARQLLPPEPVARMIPIRQARAAEIVAPLQQMIDRTVAIGDGRVIAPPTIEVVNPTNSLWVRGDAAQVRTIEEFVRALDVFEPTDMPPLRMLQLSGSDAVQIARLLTSRYDARPNDIRREQPVRIEADAATNTLVVTAHEAVFVEMKDFVESLNRNTETEAERETMIFPLRLARAVDLAKALGTLYPEPPMPLDSRGRPLPHLRQPREVFVSADAGTNTLIIEAPSGRRSSFEVLVQQLDRIELPPQATLKTWNVERGEGSEIANTLQNLARQGVLSRPGSNGEKAVEVNVQFEPRSRTLIVAGDDFTFTKVDEILADLEAVPVTRALRVIEITTGDVTEISGRATRLFEEQTEGDPDFTGVEVEVDAVNGTILAVGEDASLNRFTQIVAQLESAQASPPDIRLISLRHGEATEVATMIVELLGNELAMATLGGPAPVIEALPQVNAILVAAEPREHEIIRQIVDTIDTADEALPPIRILQVRTADAVNLANALGQTYERRSNEEKAEKPVRISADVATNALIVAAHPDLLEEIRAIVMDLNDADRLDAEGREIRIFPLRVALAEDLATTIDQMYPEPPMPRDSRGRPRPDLQQAREVVVRANPQMNALIVDAPIQRMAGFEKLVQQLDQTQIVDETEIRTWKLPTVELEAAARTLRELADGGHLGGGDRGLAGSISISIDAASDTLLVSGPTAIFDRVGQVVDSLESGPVVPTTVLRTFRLTQARADSVVPMLREILVARMTETAGQLDREIDRLLTVTADRKTNTVIISAPEVVMPVAEQLIKTLDSSAQVVGDPTVRVRPLMFADAAVVAAALQQALPGMTSPATGDAMEVKVIPAAGSNALLLVGVPEEIEEVEVLIEPLDARPATDAMDARTFELAHADASRIAPIVQKLLDDQQGSDPRVLVERIRRSRGAIDLTPTVRVEADARTNSLIVSGPQPAVNLAENLIEKLDRPDVDADLVYTTFTPARADAARIAGTAQTVLDRTRPGGVRSTLELLAEPETNSVLVVGTREETERAVALLSEWDAQIPVLPPVDFKIITMRNASADAVAAVIAPVLRDRTRWPAALRDAARAGLVISEPSVTADVSSNRILVSAPAELQSIASTLARELDQVDAGGSVEVRVYPVPTGGAADMAEALQRSLDAASDARPGEARPVVASAGRSDSIVVTASPRLQEIVAQQLSAMASSGGGVQVRTVFLKHASASRVAPLVESLLTEDSVLQPRDLPSWMRAELMMAKARGQVSDEPPIRVLPDDRLNAVIVTGPLAALNAAEQLVAQLDVAAPGGSGRSIRVLEVRNADARELATTLDELFAVADDGEAPPAIRVNASSNTLLVRATPDQFSEIRGIVEGIDDATLNVARELRTVPIDPSRGSAEDIARMIERMLDREGDDRVRIVPIEELLKKSKAADDPGSKVSFATPSEAGGMRGGIGRGTGLMAFARVAVAGIALAANPVGQDAVASTTETPMIEAVEQDEAEIVIAIDPETNSLIILGSPRELDQVVELADEVEDTLPEEGSIIRTVPLPAGVDVRNVASVVGQTIRQLVPAGGRPGDLGRRTTVVADVTSNSLIIGCRETDFDLLADLIASVARPADAPEVVVRIYRLDEMSATRAASGLVSLLQSPGRNRYRELSVTLDGDGRPVQARFDPTLIRAVADVEANALVVLAPREAIPFVDRYIELATQSPKAERATLRLFQLRYASASELQRTLRQIFQTRFRNIRRSGAATAAEPDFAVDARSNQLVVTASTEELVEVESLLKRLDVEDGRERNPLTVIELAAANPTAAARILDQAVIGGDERLRATTLVLADDASGVLLVRADAPTLAEMRDVLERIDREATSRFPVRTIELTRADAGEVAAAVQGFYDDRARLFSTGRGRRTQSAAVAITGRTGGATLLVACDDPTFEEVSQLAKTFDEKDGKAGYEYRIYPLRNARANEIKSTVESLVSSLTRSDAGFSGFGFRSRSRGEPTRNGLGSIAVEVDDRLNALIVSGQGDRFELVEELIESLDVPTPDDERRIVRYYRVPGADVSLLEEVLSDALGGGETEFRWWRDEEESTGPKIFADSRSGTLFVVGSEGQQASVGAILDDFSGLLAGGDSVVEVVRTEFADADDVARAVGRFLRDRSRSAGKAATVVVTPIETSGAMIVAGTEDDVRMVKDLVARIDAPDLTGSRSLEIVVIERGDAADMADLIGAQFDRRGGDGVVITPDARTNSILVNAPASLYPQIAALIKRLDAPDDTAESVIRTYNLQVADAGEATRILEETLRLDEDGRTTGISITMEEDPDAAPIEVQATIVADRRSNSIVVTATKESLPVIESILAKLEEAPARSPIEYRIISLEHAPAVDVSFTLNRLLLARGFDWQDVAVDYNRFENQLIVGATPDQFEVIDTILSELDAPGTRTRRTDFVALQFADAMKLKDALGNFYGPFALEADTPDKQNVRIIADEATNSLVVTAAEEEWAGILALVEQLDSEEYDASLQLAVLPLVYADARSVARAINDAFRPQVEAARRGGRRPNREESRQGDDDRSNRERGEQSPPVLMQSEEWVSASAEVQTNSLVVSANRQNLQKIERIITQLDIAEFVRLPAPRLIPVGAGDPESLAAALRTIYLPEGQNRGGTLRIVGDRPSNAVIVRADEEEFTQIRTLATALQQESDVKGVSVRVVRLDSAPAARVAASVRAAYATKAAQAKVPFSIDVDAVGNALVIASTGPFFDEVATTIREMDRLAPAAGQGIFLIDLENVPASVAERAVKRIGLDQAQPADSTSRLVVEPIKIATVEGRNALLVVANPADRETVVGILKAIDAQPEADLATNEVRIVQLQQAEAAAVVALIDQVIDPAGGGPDSTAIAAAVKEQIRRLNVVGGRNTPIALDLASPIRVTADVAGNSILISSTPANTRALVEVARLFDRLPTTEALTVQIFPLENMAADRFVGVVEDLFEQGRDLAVLPGSDIPAIPEGAIGASLTGRAALTVDERTNTVIAVGKESAVAFVEVMVGKLDSEMGTGWVEARVIPLKYADASDLADFVQAAVVEGQTDIPGGTPMQNQVARMRAMRIGGDRVVESDVFVPLSRLMVRADSQLNALVVVASPPNLSLVEELVAMLDIEAAAPGAAVRIYAVEHGSSERITTVIRQLFEQQYRSGLIRDEDRIKAVPDVRTNSIVVSTSGRSFELFENLLTRLDVEVPVDFREIRIIELANASASRLAPMIQSLMDARLERLRRVQPETAELEQAVVMSDDRSNSLVVAAGNDTFDVVERLASDLDLDSIGDAADIRVVPVTRGGLERVARAVEQVMERRYADLPADVARRQRPLVITDPRTNSLLVAASPEDRRSIEDLVERLSETPMNSAVEIEVLTLDSGAASEMAPRLESLMRDRMRSLGDAEGPSDRVSIEPLDGSNALIVAASRENQVVVRDLVDVLMQAQSDRIGGHALEIIPVARNRASDLVDLVEDLYVETENRRRGEEVVRVNADDRINAILATGTPADIEAIRDLVSRLDSEQPGAIVEVKYVPLASANVLETVALIESVLDGGGGRRGRAGQRGTVMRYLKEMEGLEPGDESGRMEVEVSSAIRDSIALTPDVRTNTVIVSAPRDSMLLIERMIRDLDTSSTGSKRIEVFKLENADADAMAEILTELFQLRQQGSLYVLKPREDIGGSADVAAQPGGDVETEMFGTDLTMVPDERQALSITVDSRINALIVSGTPKYLELVGEVVRELDAEEANERQTLVYPLRNAEAGEVARVVSEFVSEDQRKLVETLNSDQLPSAARLLEREVTIVGDAKSNAVLVNASPRYMEQVESIIKELDVDPPQVLIQVMLAEITLEDDSDFGVTLNEKVGVLPLRTSGSVRYSSTDVIGAFSQPVSGSFSVGFNDLNLVLSAMYAQGRLQLLSNPSITVANNEEGRIQVGQEIRLPDSIATFDTGTQSTTVQAQDVGIILEVRPTINPDGFVRMDIRPTISRLSEKTTDISETFRSPIIIKRTADTTVTVKDGETVVIGGLIEENSERRDMKIPLLGDLPLIGGLFRSESEVRRRTELLIVLTPRVVSNTDMGAGSLRDFTDTLVEELPLPEKIRRQIRDGRLDGGDSDLGALFEPIEPIETSEDADQSSEGEVPSDPTEEEA
jgi:type II secretion system protein D